MTDSILFRTDYVPLLVVKRACHLLFFFPPFFIFETLFFSFLPLYVTQVRYISKSASASFTRRHKHNRVWLSHNFPAACMPKITPSNNPIVALDPNPMGMVCDHGSASVGLKSTSYPAVYSSFLFTHVNAFRRYGAMRWQYILGAAGVLASLLGTAALNRIPTWSEASEYLINCFSRSCSSLIWSKTPPTSWESEACGKKERTVVSVFLNVLINNTCDGPVSNPQTLSRTLIDSTKATRSDYPGQCRNSLHEIAKYDLIIQINALNWRRPRSFDCENILSQVESCPGFIPWFPLTTSHNTPKVISPNPERETDQGASLPSSSSSSFKTSPRL